MQSNTSHRLTGPEWEVFVQPQVDYETDAILAVFAAPEAAEGAAREVDRLGHDVCAVRVAHLDGGAYQEEDGSFRDGAAGLLRGAVGGLPIGAAVGLGLGWALADGTATGISGLAGLGAFGGLVLGALVVGIARSRFDDDAAEWLAVRDGDPAVVLVVHTGGDGRSVRGLLRRAGAVGLLDPTTPAADRALAACRPMAGIGGGTTRPDGPRLARWFRRAHGGVRPDAPPDRRHAA